MACEAQSDTSTIPVRSGSVAWFCIGGEMKRWVIALLVVLAAVLLGGVGYLGARSVAEPRATPSTAPHAVDVNRGDVQQTVTAPGELVQTRQTMLSFDVSGKLTRLDLQPGDRVQAGQALAQLDAAPRAQALEKAQLKLSLAEAEHTRQLGAPGLPPNY
jgi:macrolide-specific efflux system membrane fusion protein